MSIEESHAVCEFMHHPGVTYNQWSDRTWCLCGAFVYEGRAPEREEHLACCGGPLDRWADR